MKKFLVSLILAGMLLFSCSPKFAYFTTDTTCPQCTVDSLLQPKKTYYHSWPSFSTIGINAGDSTRITTYIYVVDEQRVVVTEYDNSIYTAVTEKRRVR